MLSNLLIRRTKSGSKTIRLWDGRGMYLEITPKGGKWWRLKYWFDGRERRMSLGVYPDVSLADAREKRGRHVGTSPPASIPASNARPRPRR